jgi:hypothetical protein
MANEWDEVGQQLHGLGEKLKTHFQQTGPNQWPDALSKLGAAVEDLFKSASNAVQDEAVRADVRDVGRHLADAVSTTLGTAGTNIQEWWGSRKGGPADADSTSSPAAGPTAASDGDAPQGQDGSTGSQQPPA